MNKIDKHMEASSPIKNKYIMMKEDKVIELGIAMSDFVKSLPEVEKSLTSTFKNEVLLDNKRIIFFAQKTKSEKGMFWDIYSRESSAVH